MSEPQTIPPDLQPYFVKLAHTINWAINFFDAAGHPDVVHPEIRRAFNDIKTAAKALGLRHE